MKRILSVIFFLGIFASMLLTPSSSYSRVAVSVGIGAPIIYPYEPVYAAPAPVYVQPYPYYFTGYPYGQVVIYGHHHRHRYYRSNYVAPAAYYY